MVKRLGKCSDKINAILDVFDGKNLTCYEIAERLGEKGYEIPDNLGMFIRNHMLYEYLKKENRNGVNLYRKI